ncbi:FmdB family zinc ribbon protein [Candidatus Poriferisocius sp.]|uniref:FmdB family zinc ribbon protein n=1 Tax=Candidatus Poriferisocius sp. TaxID=3101276 RepID=UPI003B52C412
MPAYDYNCQTCGTRFEVIQSFSEDSLTICPQADSIASPAACTQPGKGQVAKVFSVPSITFKGDGFYRNDSRSGAKSSTTAGSSANGDSTNGKEGSDAAKPDAAKSDNSSSDSSGREPAKAASGSSDE